MIFPHDLEEKGRPRNSKWGHLDKKNAPMSGEKGSVTEDTGHFWIIWIGVCLSDLDSSCCLGTVVKLCFCASLASVLVLKNVTNRCLKRSLGGRQGHWAKSHWCLHGSSCALYPEQKEIVFVWASLLKEGSQMTLRCISFSMWLPCFPTLWVTTTTLRWSVFFGVTWSNKSLFQKTYACYLQTSQRFQNCENAFLRYSFEPVKEEDTVSQQEPDSIRLHPKNNGKQVCVCVFNRFLLSGILNSIIG